MLDIKMIWMKIKEKCIEYWPHKCKKDVIIAILAGLLVWCWIF
jgi:hypothetical protein